MMFVCGKDLNAGWVHFRVASGTFGCGSCFLGFCRGGGVVGFKQRRRNLVACCFRKRVMSDPVD
jgi:hypothetical protein